MCGIAGIVSQHLDHLPKTRIAKACIRALSHRGPDGCGVWSDESALLVHTRLAILDPENGHQPLVNEDGTIVVSFNGEIYNSPQLRHYLQSKGHIFKTKTDTEVLVHLYEELGPELVSELRGMFAFAIWDSRRKCLFLARDRFGIKPLYYAITHDKLLFASQPSAIFATGLLPVMMDMDSVPSFLYYGCFPPWRSAYMHIRKLQPAHCLSFCVTSWTWEIKRYWKPPTNTLNYALKDAAKHVRERIGEAVEAHLLSDVPIGVALSGGLDSSIIAYHASFVQKTPLVAFTINWDRDYGQDGEYTRAQLTARHLKIEHISLDPPRPKNNTLDDIISALDEPLGDSSIVPLHVLTANARDYVKVLLTGDGGDEVFCGYRRYTINRIEHLLSRSFRRAIKLLKQFQLSRLTSYDGLRYLRKAARAVNRLDLDDGLAYAISLGQTSPDLLHTWLTPELNQVLHEDLKRLSQLWHDSPLTHPVSRMAHVDLHFLLPEAFLVKADRASMAIGLEIRPPLLDHKLVEWAWVLHPDQKLHYATTKRLLRWAYRDVLPASVIDGPKQGFELRGLFHQVRAILPSLLDCVHSAPWKHILNTAAIRETVEQFDCNYKEFAQSLWNLYCLFRWHDYWIRGITLYEPYGALSSSRAHSHLNASVSIHSLNTQLADHRTLSG